MRVILVVVDGFGVGEMPDAKNYHKEDANTFLHMEEKLLLYVPNFEKLGIKNISGIDKSLPNEAVVGSFGKIAAKTKQNSSLMTHWEMAGVEIVEEEKDKIEATKTSVLEEFRKQIRSDILCGETGETAEIVPKFAPAHEDIHWPIVFWTTDNSMMIVCHEKVFSIAELERLGAIAKRVCESKMQVGKIQTRQLAGTIGKYYFTQAHKIFQIIPKQKSMFEKIKEKGMAVVGIGKPVELFSANPFTKTFLPKTNDLSMKLAENEISNQSQDGLILVNLPDTDSVFGHKNDFLGYRLCLEKIDAFLGRVVKTMKKDDLLIVTSDHGNDPTLMTTRHTREYVPLLLFGESVKSGVNLGELHGLKCISQIVLEKLNVEIPEVSVLQKIQK